MGLIATVLAQLSTVTVINNNEHQVNIHLPLNTNSKQCHLGHITNCPAMCYRQKPRRMPQILGWFQVSSSGNSEILAQQELNGLLKNLEGKSVHEIALCHPFFPMYLSLQKF